MIWLSLDGLATMWSGMKIQIRIALRMHCAIKITRLLIFVFLTELSFADQSSTLEVELEYNSEPAFRMTSRPRPTFVSSRAGVVDWLIELPIPADGILKAAATGDIKMVVVRHNALHKTK